MLPEAQHGPAGSVKSQVGIKISFAILINLRPPIFCVLLGLGGVLRTSVPKASVHEHCNMQARKGDVRDSTRALQDFEVDTVTKSSTEELTA